MVVAREKARELFEELGLECAEEHDAMAAGGNSAVEGPSPVLGATPYVAKEWLGPTKGPMDIDSKRSRD